MDDFTSGHRASDQGQGQIDQLARQDLGPLSVAELELRITALEAEIDRTRAHLAKVAVHRASAEALFRK